MSELVPSEIIIEENQQNVDKAKKNKKLILWGILVVLVLIILYVLFGDEYKKYRLNTETRKDLVKDLVNSAVATSAVSNPLLSETSSNTVGQMTSLSSTSPNSPNSSTSVSAIRKSLANLFKSY